MGYPRLCLELCGVGRGSGQHFCAKESLQYAIRAISHQSTAGVLGSTTYIGPTGKIIEIEAQAILRKGIFVERTEVSAGSLMRTVSVQISRFLVGEW